METDRSSGDQGTATRVRTETVRTINVVQHGAGRVTQEGGGVVCLGVLSRANYKSRILKMQQVSHLKTMHDSYLPTLSMRALPCQLICRPGYVTSLVQGMLVA